MPASTVRADYDQLTQIARRFGTEADSIGRMNQGLKREVDVLRGGDWIGTGAKAFYAEMDGQVMPSLGRLAARLDAVEQLAAERGARLEELAALRDRMKEQAGFGRHTSFDEVWERMLACWQAQGGAPA